MKLIYIFDIEILPNVKNLLVISFLFSIHFCLAQPQWKFHIAFEDATGAKDTIWMIWDSTATTFGVDTFLGESPVTFNYNSFNVFIFNTMGDSTKTVAVPYYAPYPFPQLYLETQVYSLNYTYPLTIRWDSSLFQAPFLPGPVYSARIDNQFFFLVNNSGFDHFDMLIDNYAIAPAFSWGSQNHFPMAITMSRDTILTISNNENIPTKIKIYPQPFSNFLNVMSLLELKMEITSLLGETVLSKNISIGINHLDLSHLADAVYIIRFKTKENKIYYEKILKAN